MHSVTWRMAWSAGADGAPYRHLAVRIIDQAFRDLADPSRSPEDQQSAREFLAGSSMLRHWCEVADLDPSRTVARARQLMDRRRPLVSPTRIVDSQSPKERRWRR